MRRIRKGDTVQIAKGKDKGKKGRVLNLLSSGTHALIEGLNMVKKHKRKTHQDQQGGIVSIEMPVSIANLRFLCKHCNRASRVGFSILKDGTKVRICKSCKEAI